MSRLVFIDTEFTDLLQPRLLSLGMVSLEGREHYVELDVDDPAHAEVLSSASDFVRFNGVLEQWGRVPGAADTPLGMGSRTADWLLDMAGETSEPVVVCFDYSADHELLVECLQDAGQWEALRGVIRPANVDRLIGTITGELAAEAEFAALRSRGLARHHALADALALRAAYLAVLAQHGGVR